MTATDAEHAADDWLDQQEALADERDAQEHDGWTASELHADLERHITARVDDERFTVDSMEKADWAVRKIARERRRLAEARELAKAERSRIDEWEAEQTQRCETATAFFEDLLQNYHRRLLDDDPKAKTVRLPSGELVARKLPDSLICDGGDDTIEWTEQHEPDAVVVRKTVDRSKMKRRLGVGSNERPEGFEAIDPATGEVVPGFWFQVGAVSFKVRTDVDQ